MPWTTLSKLKTSRRQILEIPASIKSMLGKPAKSSRAAEQALCDWSTTAQTCFLIGRGTPDTCWLLNLTPLTIYAHFYSLLMWSLCLILACLHHRLVENTRSRTCGFAGKVQVKFTTKTLSHCICVAQKRTLSLVIRDSIRKRAKFSYLK